MTPLPWLPRGGSLLALAYGVFTWGPAVVFVAVLPLLPEGSGTGLEGPMFVLLGGVVLGTLSVVALAGLAGSLGLSPSSARVGSFLLAGLSVLGLVNPVLIVSGLPAMAGVCAARLGGLTRGSAPQEGRARAAGYVGLGAVAVTLLADLVLLALLVGSG